MAEDGWAESMRIKVDPAAFIQWCREQGDGWKKIAATGELINEETGDRASLKVTPSSPMTIGRLDAQL